MSDVEWSEQIAFNLHQPGQDLAFVVHRERIYAAYCPCGFRGPSSAVVKLLQSLFDTYQDQSFFILRNRIYSTAPLQARCQGMIKTVAKRGRGNVVAKSHGPGTLPTMIAGETEILGGPDALALRNLLSAENKLDLRKIEELRRPDPLAWLKTVAALNPRGEVLHDFDRDIACLLLDEHGKLLAYGLNCNSKNKTLHAEVNLVQRYYLEHRRPLPERARLYTTRKPCKMCAGMILDFSERPESLQIFYAEDDKSSRQTSLDAVVHWNRLDSV
jgi:tRNA(Arg) A34 adenosine deaminase TadA